jgi:hypothetical protein
MTKSAQDRRVDTPSTQGAVRDRRPGHSSDRTLRRVDRPDHPLLAPTAPRGPWPPTGGHRRRGRLPGGRAGAAALPRRAPLAAGRAIAGRAPVPPAAVAARIQPAAAAARLAAGSGAALAGRPHPQHGRAAAAGRWHPGRLWPLADHRHALGPVRLRRLRPRHLAPLLLLGRPAAADLYLRGDRHRVRAGQPQAVGRT